MDFLGDMGDWMFGGARRNRQRVEERHSMDIKRMQSLLASEKGRTLLNKARAATMDRGDGGERANQRIDQISKLVSAADKTLDDKLSESLNKQAQYLTDEIEEERTRSKKVDADRGGDFIGPMPPAGEPEAEIPLQNKYTLQKQFDQDRLSAADYLADDTARAWERPAGPRTYSDIGITSVDDMATIDELQKALPEVDMREQYESEPENMQRLMRLWKEKRINKKNLHKFFSSIQMKAQEALGIA